MLERDDSKAYKAICRIEQKLSEFANSCSDTLTPNVLMDCLKRPAEDPQLSELGSLIITCLKDPSQLEIIRWIVFHFDLPSPFSAIAEVATRNWISIRCSEQKLLDAVHEETISVGTTHIANIYAPSIVAAKLPEANPELTKGLRSKLWLYRFDDIPLKHIYDTHKNYKNDFSNYELVYFAKDSDNKHVHVLWHENNRSEATISTLGKLLGGEREEIATDRFYAFEKLIKYRSANDFSHLKREVAELKCNFYARVPVFFYFPPHEYMTEIFVAFHDSHINVKNVVSVLHDLAPVLRVTVSLINSQIAYLMGDISGESRMNKMLLRIVRHGLGNWTTRARACADNAIIEEQKGDSSKFGIWMHHLRGDCGIGSLASIGLQQYGVNERDIEIGRIEKVINDEAKLSDYVDVQVMDSVRYLIVPGRTLLVVSELIDNAIREQRNRGFDREKLSLTITDGENNRANIEIRNKGELLLPHDIKTNEGSVRCTTFPEGHGLSLCAELLERIGGEIVLSQQDNEVTARITVPLK